MRRSAVDEEAKRTVEAMMLATAVGLVIVVVVVVTLW